MNKLIDFLSDSYILLYIVLPLLISCVSICILVLLRKKPKNKIAYILLSSLLVFNILTVSMGTYNYFRPEYINNELIKKNDIQSLAKILSENAINEIFPYDNTFEDEEQNNENSIDIYNKRLNFPIEFLKKEVPIYNNSYIDICYTRYKTINDANVSFNGYILDFNEQAQKIKNSKEIFLIDEAEFRVAVSPINIYHSDYIGTIRMDKTYRIAIQYGKEIYLFTETSSAIGNDWNLPKMIRNDNLF